MAKPVSGSHSGLMYDIQDIRSNVRYLREIGSPRSQRYSKKHIKRLINKSNRKIVKHSIIMNGGMYE